MVRLCVDTSSDYLIIVVADEEEVLGSVSIKAGRKISELLLEQIDNLLKSLSINISDIDEFYAGTGPGSFTGVRIGVAMVLGLSEGLSRKAYGLSSIDIQASSNGKKGSFEVISQLKGRNYALKRYDFINNVFSDYIISDIDDDKLLNYVKVNIDGCYVPELVQAVKTGLLWQFKSECVPVYLRKSEAELNLDKKGSL